MRTRAIADLGEDDRMESLKLDIVSMPHVRRAGMGGINLLAGYLRSEPAVDAIFEPPLQYGGGADRNAVPGYDIPTHTYSKRIVEAPAVRTSALRSLGAQVNVAAIEAAMDAAAALAGADPVAFRLAHLSDPRAREVLERAARMAGWASPGHRGVGYARYKNAAAYCAVVVEISLDESVRVEQVWCAVDAGAAIDPDGVRNQIEGGVIQAISWTLKEAAPFAGGAVAMTGWADYPILGFAEVPQVTVEIIDRPEELPLGVGEAAAGPATAALCGAITRALGLRMEELPITRDKILAALA